jgi:NADH-quinone oxidoreductase E subunit
MLTDKMIERIQALQHMYPDKRSRVMGALWVVQRARGWKLTQADLEDIARLLDISPVEAQAAASFYTMYNFVEQAGGRYHIQLCHNISCSLLGADDLIGHLEKTLGIKPGETTRDKGFSLTTVECLGSCGTAPMMQVNDDYYENLTVEKLDEIIQRLKHA